MAHSLVVTGLNKEDWKQEKDVMINHGDHGLIWRWDGGWCVSAPRLLRAVIVAKFALVTVCMIPQVVIGVSTSAKRTTRVRCISRPWQLLQPVRPACSVRPSCRQPSQKLWSGFHTACQACCGMIISSTSFSTSCMALLLCIQSASHACGRAWTSTGATSASTKHVSFRI